MSLPAQSRILALSTQADFADCFSIKVPHTGQSALELFLTMAKKTPTWINSLMRLRNAVVAKLGLKNLGVLSEVDNRPIDEYQVGDRVGIFSIHSISEKEVILEDKDKHLHAKVSVLVQPYGEQALVQASTVVHTNNTLGKVYMFFVTPVHKLIVPASLRTLKSALQAPRC